MFFNSLNKRLKRAYTKLNPPIRDMVFPNGEAEFMFVGTLLNREYKQHDLGGIIMIYASVSNFYRMSLGNCYTTFNYAQKKMQEYTHDEILKMVAISMLTVSKNKNFMDNPIEQIEKLKSMANTQIKTYIVISENMNIFGTKDNEKIGTTANPLLLAGIKGVEEYFSSLISNKTNNTVNHTRTSAIYLTNEETNLDYALDEYTLTDSKTQEELAKVWVNVYGIKNTELCIKDFSFKTESK